MKSGIVAITLFWLAIVGISCWWNLTDERRESEQLAFETARAFIRQLVITRAWNAEHEGVYVPISKDMAPNPYLDDPLRDLVTDKGIALTKINPAYMTRQISEIASLENGIKFHITSLKPIRPANKATAWEEQWLRSFEQGAVEHGDFVRDGGQSFFATWPRSRLKRAASSATQSKGTGQGRLGAASVSPSPTWPRRKTPSSSPATPSPPGWG